jgi:hypothetical protein
MDALGKANFSILYLNTEIYQHETSQVLPKLKEV